MLPAYKQERGWSARIGAALTALLEYFDADPATAALCVVDSLAAGPEALERRAAVVDSLVGAVDRGRREPDAPSWPQPRHRRGRGGRRTGRAVHPPARAGAQAVATAAWSADEHDRAALPRPRGGGRRAGAPRTARAPVGSQPRGPAEAAGHAPHLPHDARAVRRWRRSQDSTTARSHATRALPTRARCRSCWRASRVSG